MRKSPRHVRDSSRQAEHGARKEYNVQPQRHMAVMPVLSPQSLVTCPEQALLCHQIHSPCVSFQRRSSISDTGKVLVCKEENINVYSTLSQACPGSLQLFVTVWHCRCPKPTLNLPFLNSRVGLFSEERQFLLLENVVPQPRPGYQACTRLLSCSCCSCVSLVRCENCSFPQKGLSILTINEMCVKMKVTTWDPATC